MAKEFVLKRTGQRPLRFRGEEIWSWATSPDRAHPNYLGSTGRWQEIELYRTEGGKYVLWVANRTQWQGEEDVLSVEFFNDIEEVVSFLEDHYPGAAPGLAEEMEIAEEIE